MLKNQKLWKETQKIIKNLISDVKSEKKHKINTRSGTADKNNQDWYQ